VKIKISPSSKLWYNLILQLQNCVDLVLLTKFVKFSWRFKYLSW